MSNTTNIIFNDIGGNGNVTLYANPFQNGNKYYARFDCVNVDVDNLIARMQKKDIGVNPINVKHILSLLKVEMLEALQKGEAVNLFDLGKFYIAASKTTGNTPETAEVGKLQVKFTPSKELNNTVSNLTIKKIAVASSAPMIDSVIDLFTGNTDGTLTGGKIVRIEGGKLKIVGDDCGIFFVSCDETGKFSDDETTWLQIESDKIVRNTNKTLEFFLPDTLEKDNTYKIILKTNGTKLKRPVKTMVTEIVSIK